MNAIKQDMPVDRALLAQTLSKERAPNWRCPRCNGGHLRLVSQTVQSEYTGDTKEASAHEAFDAEWVETRFVALLRCDNNDCKEVTAVAGTGKVVEVPNWEAQDIDYEDAFTPLYVKPSPPLIQVPADCPDSIKAELKLAADAQWGDAGAAATHLRIAVERLLDARKIPKTKISKKKQRVRLSLYEQINRLNKAVRNREAL